MPDWFVASGSPGTKAGVDSAPVRSELSAISASFAKMPGLAGNALRLVRVNAGGTGLESVALIDAIAIGSVTPSSGAFTTLSSSGGITGNLTGAVTGNASTATALQNARTINGVSFNGTANITVTATATNTLTFGAHLTGTSYNGSAPITIGTDATNLNTVSAIVARDASGNFSAGTISAALSGNASTASLAANSTLLGGAAPDTGNGASTIAQRTPAGYLFAGYFNQNSSSSENPSIGSFFVESGGDGYHRKATLANVQTQLGCALLASSPLFTGVVKGNNGGLGLGQITVTTTTGSPAGGTNGDMVLVY